MKDEPKPFNKVESPEAKSELSFLEQIELAEKMINAAEARDQFSRDNGGGDFEGFAAYGQYEGNNRESYDALVRGFELARAEFDSKVPNKLKLIKYLKSVNEKELAKEISKMFRSETNLAAAFKNLFK